MTEREELVCEVETAMGQLDAPMPTDLLPGESRGLRWARNARLIRAKEVLARYDRANKEG